MQTTLTHHTSTTGLFRQVITPDERRDSIPIPREWFGRRVEIIVFPVLQESEKPPNAKPFRVNRRRLESMRVSSSPEFLSDHLIRADRDAR